MLKKVVYLKKFGERYVYSCKLHDKMYNSDIFCEVKFCKNCGFSDFFENVILKNEDVKMFEVIIEDGNVSNLMYTKKDGTPSSKKVLWVKKLQDIKVIEKKSNNMNNLSNFE